MKVVRCADKISLDRISREKLSGFLGNFVEVLLGGLITFPSGEILSREILSAHITVKFLNDIAALYVTMPVGLCGSLSLSLLVSLFVCLSPRSDLK